MLANNTAVFAEGIRQGQAETEWRIVRMKMVRRRTFAVNALPSNSILTLPYQIPAQNPRLVQLVGMSPPTLVTLIIIMTEKSQG